MTAPEQAAPKTYWCSECGAVTTTVERRVPAGWWLLNQAVPYRGYPYTRRGIFCSAACLSLAAPRFDAEEQHRQRRPPPEGPQP